MTFSDGDMAAIWLTVRLAATVTVVLLLLGTPLAWWLARTRSWWKGPVGALVALPLVLPPTVLGFYLLIAMGPNGPMGAFTESLGVGTLAFTFWGLVVGSVFYRVLAAHARVGDVVEQDADAKDPRAHEQQQEDLASALARDARPEHGSE